MANDFFQQPISTYQGFGINPAYTTPAYMSNFRPAYASDSDPYNAYTVNRGYGEAVRQQYLFGPTHGTYASDPAQEDRANNWAINTAHSDAFMGGITKVGVPIAAWYGANKFFGQKVAASSPTSGLWNRGSAFASSLYRGEGMGAARTAWGAAVARQSLGAATGSVMGGAAGRVFGGGLGMVGRALGAGASLSGAGAIGGGIGAVLGGALGSFALPLVAGAAAAQGVNNLIAEPYVGIRRGEDAMLANTANTFVGGQQSPNLGTFGISATHANALSRSFMKSNVQDMGFQPGDYAAMADYGMQAGIFNDIGNMNVDQMKKRVEGMADSVKLIMAVANTNSVKEAIQYMGRLKAGGANNPGAVTRVMSEMGIASGISGTSVEQIMNTVGNQGQMVAQRLGILPIMGQRAAAATYAGFANAYKTGTIHASDMAAMGGTEGATQRIIEGTGRMMDSAYFKAAINSGAELGTGNMLNISEAYGKRRASNPLRTFAEDQLNFGPNASKYMETHSSESIITNILADRAGATPSARAPDGKLDFLNSLGLAIGSNWLSSDEARAAAESWKARLHPEYMERLEQATTGTAQKQFSQRRSQNGDDTLAGVPLIGRMISGSRQMYRNVLEGSAEGTGAFTKLRAESADSWDSISAWASGMARVKDRPIQYYTMKEGQQALETTEIKADFGVFGNGMAKGDIENQRRASDYDSVLKSLAADYRSSPEDSEIGKISRKLIGNLGKKDSDNRYDLNTYYNLKKGDVGAVGMNRKEYASFTNRGVQFGKMTTNAVTVKDINPQLDKLMRSGYREAVDDLMADQDLTFTQRFGDRKSIFEGNIHKEDGNYLFNAVVRSQKETGKPGLEGLFDISGGEDSFYSKGFGDILQKSKNNPNSLSPEEKERLRTYQALQRASGMKAGPLSKINQAIIGLSQGDTSMAGALSDEGDILRQKSSQAAERSVDYVRKNHTEAYVKSANLEMARAGYTGKDLNVLNTMTTSAIRNASSEGAARDLNNADRETQAALNTIEKNKKEVEDFNKQFSAESLKALKSFGDNADAMGKAFPELSKSASELLSAANSLKELKSDNPKLAEAVNNLNRTLLPLVKQNQANPGLTNNFRGR